MRNDQPPTARRISHERIHHGDRIIDEYAWLADKDNPETLAYLESENAYTDHKMRHLGSLRGVLFEEIKSRTQETDLSVPIRKGEYWYYARTEEGKQYPIYCRIAISDGDVVPPSTEDGAPRDNEEVLLDSNQLAKDKDFFALGTYDVSPDGKKIAYSTDFLGNERFTLTIIDLSTKKVIGAEIPDVHYGSAWSLDGSTIFYITANEAWRPHRVWSHSLATPSAEDSLVYEEADERFFVSVELTRSEKYIIISTNSKITSEIHVIPADEPTLPPRIIAPRQQGVEYSVSHHAGAIGSGTFLILHNAESRDFAVSMTPADKPGEWKTLIPHEPGTRLIDVDVFAEYLVVALRREGMTGIRVIPILNHRDSSIQSPKITLGNSYDIRFPETVYTVMPDNNLEYATTTYRLGYTSLVTPESSYDCDLTTGDLTLLKRKPVLGDFDPSRYEQHREWAIAEDGTRIPISLVCRQDVPRDGTAACVLYGYGSYEASMDPWFSIPRLSLLDRGVIFAVAHIRGGGELGRQWYEDGKLLMKKNTFTDFIAAAKHLVAQEWTTPDRLIARGGSAGGLLMGAVANTAPSTFCGIVAQVPFVDALTTILDPSLPLTITEWEEWGNPLENKDVYEYMKSYTPYENISMQHYPAILAVTSINDTRVSYHEPTKWVARLRATAVDPDILLKVDMSAGHGGPSGRYDAWKEEAFVLAWTLDHLSIDG